MTQVEYKYEQFVTFVTASSGIIRAQSLFGPDAGEGTFTAGHGTGAPAAPFPQALRPSLVHRSSHEALPPSLSITLLLTQSYVTCGKTTLTLVTVRSLDNTSKKAIY